MKNIYKMGRRELLALKPEEITRPFKVKEVEHIASVLGVHWLESANIKRIMAQQIAWRFSQITEAAKPHYVVAIPNGVTDFGQEVADILKATYACLKNIAGLTNKLNPGDRVLLVGGVCTDGADFTEAVMAIKSGCPEVIVMPYFPVIINLGILIAIGIEGKGGPFYIVSVIKSKTLKRNQAMGNCRPASCSARQRSSPKPRRKNGK